MKRIDRFSPDSFAIHLSTDKILQKNATDCILFVIYMQDPRRSKIYLPV